MRKLTNQERSEIARRTKDVCQNFRNNVAGATTFFHTEDDLVVRVHVSIKTLEEMNEMAARVVRGSSSEGAK